LHRNPERQSNRNNTDHSLKRCKRSSRSKYRNNTRWRHHNPTHYRGSLKKAGEKNMVGEISMVEEKNRIESRITRREELSSLRRITQEKGEKQ
jgi:hypothetical protein